MNTTLIVARAAHFASAMLLFGGFAFALFVAAPVPSGAEGDRRRAALHRWLVIGALWSLAAAVASALAWFGCEGAAMSGKPLAQALSVDTLRLVLSATAFGRLWITRMVLAIVLALVSLAMLRSGSDSFKRSFGGVAFALAGAYLASLASAGHAAAGAESQRWIQLGADCIHLLAAGAWIGALAALVLFLSGNVNLDAAARTARRFSVLGLTSVSALLFTGIVNTYYLVGDIPSLIGTHYGRLLLAKLALFGAMLALAATNRLMLTPRLAQRSPDAARALRRNAVLEIAGAAGVVSIVGVLGVTIPGAHDSPVWPFSHTLDWSDGERSMASLGMLAALGVAAVIGIAAAEIGVRRLRPAVWVGGLAAIAVIVAASAWVLAVPANPTTYASSPVGYTVRAIAHGREVYAQDCAACHGASGRGNGPAAASLTVRPSNLVEHTPNHRPGDLYWWIGHGIAGTPMPGFAKQASETDLWSVIAYLRALSESDAARAMTNSVEPWRPIVAPDFTFELGGAQESLAHDARKHVTLLVFYTLPQSLSRLDDLAAQGRSYAEAGVRIIALPMPASANSAMAAPLPDGSMEAIAEPRVADTYAMFAPVIHNRSDAAQSAHFEFLIDRQAYLRARWLGVAERPAERTSQILAQAAILNRESPHPMAMMRHAH